MKIDFYAGDELATVELLTQREGRFVLKVTSFADEGCMPRVARGKMEAAQLKQLAKAALELAGEKELASRIPRYAPWWSNQVKE